MYNNRVMLIDFFNVRLFMPNILITLFRQLPAHEKWLTFPTLLTIIRISLTPLVVGAMIAQKWGCAFLLFLIAAITDVLDGWLARLYNNQTFIGASLDPVADKLLLVSCFVTLAFVQSPLFAIPLWFVGIILCKEVLLIIGVIVFWSIKGIVQIRPTRLSKLTTFVQVCFIIWLFACYFFSWLPVKTYWTMLGLLLFLTIVVLGQYAWMGWCYLTQE